MNQPKVALYCGHMFSAGSPMEAPLAGRIATEIDRLGITAGFGPLACGADILIAEALLERGSELHVVLPFAEDDFIPESVLCGGDAWLPRFEACRDAALSLHFATPGAYVGDDNQFAYNTRLAMGLAVLYAQAHGGDAVQLAVVSDDLASLSRTGLAGTVADIRLWQDLGRESVTIPAGPVPRNLRFPPSKIMTDGTSREIRSIIFADYKGYSRLGERELPLFMDEVMGRVGAVLGEFGNHVEFRNSWGDALYAIIDKPENASKLALRLQQRMTGLPEALNPPGGEAGMRVGLHYGPIWVGTDRVTGNRIWYGGEVTRTARIEPVTPVGGVFCTEAFAAALLVANCSECKFTPVGQKPLAKDFGEVELYQLEWNCAV